MRTGRETLGNIDAALKGARRDLDRLDRELTDASDALAANRRSQARAMRELAGVRLGGLAEGTVTALDSADRRAQETLSKRAQAIDDLEGEIDLARHELAAAEEARERAHDQVDEAARELAELEASVQASLDQDAEYQAQLERSRKADAVASAAEEKTRLAESDRAEKGKPYESDDLFTYLWRRDYGTSEYRANPVARLLDGWVARLIRYRDDPDRPIGHCWKSQSDCAAHAEAVREAAREEVEALEGLELAAADRAGNVPGAQDALAARGGCPRQGRRTHRTARTATCRASYAPPRVLLRVTTSTFKRA